MVNSREENWIFGIMLYRAAKPRLAKNQRCNRRHGGYVAGGTPRDPHPPS
jgi:hypothetical protein